jgi:hypothetical protein
MPESMLQEIIRQTAEKQQVEVGEKIVETQIKILTTSYDKAAAYNNVVIIAGYAAYFGLWSLTKTYITRDQAMWSALLMGSSMATFVFFQVFQMMFVSHSLHKKYLTFSEKIRGKPAPEVLAELKKLEEGGKRATLRFLPIWRIHLLVAVSTGLLGFLVLGYAFVLALL